MVVGEGAYPEQRRHDRDAGPLGEQPQLHLGPRERDAVAGQDERPLCAPQEHRGPLERRRLGRWRGLAQPAVAVVVARGELHVLGHVDEHGTRPAAARDLERPPHRRVQLVGILDEERMLGERQRHAHDVGLLEGVLAHRRTTDLARDRHERHRVHLRRGEPRDEVGRPRPARGHAHPYPARRPGVAVGRVRSGLLVADEDVL